MKQCARLKCKKDFEPNKPKQRFCSDKCRVYHSRETRMLKQKSDIDLTISNATKKKATPPDQTKQEKSQTLIDIEKEFEQILNSKK